MSSVISVGVKRYEKESARSDTPNTSGLSPYLHFGQISPQTVYHESKLCKSPKFIRKLAWRDLSYWLLTLFPEMPTLPMRPHYRVSMLVCKQNMTSCAITSTRKNVVEIRNAQSNFTPAAPEVESKQEKLEGVAERYDRLPISWRCHEGALDNRLDEQLHETCRSFLSHRVFASSLDWRIQLVSGRSIHVLPLQSATKPCICQSH